MGGPSFVRFDGTPGWDSDNIYSVNEAMVTSGSPEDFRKDPKSFLFELDSPHGVNRFTDEIMGGIQADLIEIRICFVYERGAFELYPENPANSWKETPWLKALRVEYVAPITVHYTEEVR